MVREDSIAKDFDSDDRQTKNEEILRLVRLCLAIE